MLLKVIVASTAAALACAGVFQNMQSIIQGTTSAFGALPTAGPKPTAPGSASSQPLGSLARKRAPAPLSVGCGCNQPPACALCGQTAACANAGVRAEDLCVLPASGAGASVASKQRASRMSASQSSSTSESSSDTSKRIKFSDNIGNTWTASSSNAQLALIAPLASSSDSDASEWEYYYEYVSK